MGMTADVVAKVNEVGSDRGPGKAPPPPPPKKRDNRKLYNWLLGFALSCLPVLLGPFVKLLLKEPFLQVLMTVVTDISIIYIGVSLTVSAMNDLEPGDHARRTGYVVMLVLASATYAVINAAQQLAGPDAVNTALIIALNGAFLALPLICGGRQYLRKSGG